MKPPRKRDEATQSQKRKRDTVEREADVFKEEMSRNQRINAVSARVPYSEHDSILPRKKKGKLCS